MRKCPTCGKEWPECNVKFREDGAVVIWFFKNKKHVYISDNGDCLILNPQLVKWVKKALKNQGEWFNNGAKRKD